MANILIDLRDYEYLQSLISLVNLILFIFVLFLVIIGNISYDFIRRKQLHVRNVSSAQYENGSINVIEEKQEKVTTLPHISDISTNNQISDSGKHPSKSLSTRFPENIKISTVSLRQLICYCDGSYSYESQIGFSGFRASNGYSKYRRCPIRFPENGSTESEVFAAYLALQYIAECKYDYEKIIIYTDNSKVIKLLKNPKPIDYYDYAMFFENLNQCYKRKGHIDLQVKFISANTTWYEQQQCAIKYEFAKVDQEVQRRRQRYEQQFQNNIVYATLIY